VNERAEARSLEGRAAVVAGGSRGIGRAVARRLAREGAAVVVNGRDAEAARAVAAEIQAEGGRAHACPGSVADFDVAGTLVETCVDAFGAIDVLVNCAGVAEPEASSILDVSPEAFRAVVDVHLGGTFNTCRHAAPRMAAQGHGAIVNTSSHAHLGLYGGTAYPAGKGATNALTLAIAAELRDRGVRANAVCPGARTRLNEGPGYVAKIESLHARGLLDDALRDASLAPPDAEHVAPLYAFLASDRAAGITGRIFSAAGGYVGLQPPGGETLLAWRSPEDGPWPVAALAEAVRTKLDGA
jgi:NAD(P)-dependent dehydrogenase (short-subunit alcohol dehydrogenase family)